MVGMSADMVLADSGPSAMVTAISNRTRALQAGGLGRGGGGFGRGGGGRGGFGRGGVGRGGGRGTTRGERGAGTKGVRGGQNWGEGPGGKKGKQTPPAPKVQAGRAPGAKQGGRQQGGKQQGGKGAAGVQQPPKAAVRGGNKPGGAKVKCATCGKKHAGVCRLAAPKPGAAGKKPPPQQPNKEKQQQNGKKQKQPQQQQSKKQKPGRSRGGGRGGDGRRGGGRGRGAYNNGGGPDMHRNGCSCPRCRTMPYTWMSFPWDRTWDGPAMIVFYRQRAAVTKPAESFEPPLTQFYGGSWVKVRDWDMLEPAAPPPRAVRPIRLLPAVALANLTELPY